MIEYMDRLCPAMDQELTRNFKKMLEKQGFKFMLKTKVIGGRGSANGCKVDVEPAEGGAKQTLDADIVLVATGRKPFTGGLQLEKAGL